MDTSTNTITSSSSSLSDNFNNIFSTLFPPRNHMRPRSHSGASLPSSRSVTPVPSIAPSSAVDLRDLSLQSDTELPDVLKFTPNIVDHLDARDILSMSQAATCFRSLRKPETFIRHITLAGWDTEALVRRTRMASDSKGTPWMFLARSAIQKDDILTRYASLPNVDDKKKKYQAAVKKFWRILINIVTEHDRRNFSKLTALANSLQMNFIQFITAIPAYNWKSRYCKTFVVAAYINSQPTYPEGDNDLDQFSKTLSFESEDPKPPFLLLAARANLLYAYACMSYSKTSPCPLRSTHYDGPHLTTKGFALPGVRQAIERCTNRISIGGFYRKVNADISPMRIEIDPIGLMSKSRLPFAEKQLLTLEATVHADKDTPSWRVTGSIDRTNGIGELVTASGMVYDVWLTPWGLTGQKVRGEGKHLGYFVLHWP